MVCALSSMEYCVIVSNLKILAKNGLSVTDTVTDPSQIPSLFSIPASITRSRKANYLLPQDPLQFWPMRWRLRPTGATVGKVLLCLIKGAKVADTLVPFIHALNMDVLPGVMAATL